MHNKKSCHLEKKSMHSHDEDNNKGAAVVMVCRWNRTAQKKKKAGTTNSNSNISFYNTYRGCMDVQ
jgi:hypothetical protein